MKKLVIFILVVFVLNVVLSPVQGDGEAHTGSIIESITPTIVSDGVPVIFTADVMSPPGQSVVSYSWDFGDGNKQETSVNSVIHQYSSIGIYILELKIKDSSDYEADKKIMIIVGNIKDTLNYTLKKYRERINNLTAQILEYPAWYQNLLTTQLNISVLDSSLSEFEGRFSLNSAQYTEILSNLSELRVPAFITKGKEFNYPILLSSNANFNYLEEMGAGNVENLSGLEEGLLKWYSSSGLEASVDYFMVYAQYDNKKEAVISYFKLKLKPKENQPIDNYLIIGEKADFNAVGVKEFDDAIGIAYSNLEAREFEFVIPGQINPIDLNIYMSPQFSKLDLSVIVISCNLNGVCDAGENWSNCREDCKPTGWIIFYIAILIFAAFICYIIIQWWYNKKYESHLFKNKNELFNLINFIDNALTKGLNIKEIRKNLQKVGWNSEQIDYAFKKIKGKKIMPIEINFPKFGTEKSKR